MIVSLVGTNAQQIDAELSALVSTFVDHHGDLSLEKIDCEEVDVSRIIESLQSLPFLSEKKLVVLRQPSKNKSFLEQAEQYFGEVADSTDVIIVEPKLDKRLSYYKFLKTSTDFREFGELDQPALVNYLVKRAKEQNAEISVADARYLIERVGTDQQLLTNELDKLVTFQPVVTRQSIDLLTEANVQSSIFELLDSAFAGSKKRVARLYQEQLAQNVEPQQIIAMLAWQLHVLAIIKSAGQKPAQQIASEAKLNPYVVSKSQNIARGLSISEVKKLISELRELDQRSKTGSIDLGEALQTYLLGLN